ncbi:methionyl-tRNA formyltransferase [Paucilactobacillus wasatchensis]|uniref:Methionyl-tRNA formyltransferase n=1 Tax=Paucilactobacillus wasatchensis TaxID=1335616 RepID=A0A0D0YVY9_9LACO|nr:methionyl-tRNA formyltransferase [Paucilactobacillus wasatchensis]KIS03444.1 Methionyl-tRNA formyltransferase [Paucilactobacillus wasatchensis]
MTSIVFMGTPQFAVPILQSLIDHHYDVKAVVTQPDRFVGRKHVLTASPVKQLAVNHQIEVLQPEKINHSSEMDRVIELQPDLIVTAAFGQFLPTKLLAAAQVGAINVHGSLLPKYRGGAPVQYAIMNGEQETGISIIYMVKKMDAGDILAQRKIAITKKDDTGSMFTKLSLLGRDLLLETIPQLLKDQLSPVAQDENQVTFAPNISSEEERIDITTTAQQIDCKVRALRPFPIANLNLDKTRTKLWQVSVAAEPTTLKPGQVVSVTKHELVIAAGQGTAILLKELQPAGKPRMSITDYLNGHQNIKAEMQVVTNER